MAAPSTEELRCPTCGARQGLVETCRRCKSDLRLLGSALAAYDRHRGECLRALRDGRLGAAARHAATCRELRPGPESRRLLTVCRLARGDWPGAIEAADGLPSAAHHEGD